MPYAGWEDSIKGTGHQQEVSGRPQDFCKRDMSSVNMDIRWWETSPTIVHAGDATYTEVLSDHRRNGGLPPRRIVLDGKLKNTEILVGGERLHTHSLQSKLFNFVWACTTITEAAPSSAVEI